MTAEREPLVIDEIRLGRFLRDLRRNYEDHIFAWRGKRLFINVRADEWTAPIRRVAQADIDRWAEGRIKVICHGGVPEPGIIEMFVVDDGVFDMPQWPFTPLDIRGPAV